MRESKQTPADLDSFKLGFPVLLASVAMTLCLGAAYSWSLFVEPLKAALGIGQGMAQIPFTLFYVCFPLTTLVAGRVMSRIGYSGSAALGGLLFGCGWLLAGFGASGYAFVIVGIGVVGGVGVALAYLVPISAGVLWFPHHKGLVTGIALAGFGAGSALVAFVGGLLLHGAGATPFSVFRLLGFVFLVIIVAAASQMRVPEGASRGPQAAWSLPRAFRERGFAALYFAMFTGLMAGLVIISNIKQLAAGTSTTAGATAVALFAVANALGRILWGAISDRLRPGVVLPLNLLLQSTLLICPPLLLSAGFGLNLLALGAGFNFGGVLVLYAAAVARRWGSESVPGLYGQLFSANAPASLAAVAAGFVFDHTASFALPLTAIAAAMILGAVTVRKALSEPLPS